MEALGSIMKIFRETTEASGSGKITFGLIATIWSASVGISAIQDILNAVYKVQETRSYIKARLSAIAVTIILTVLGTFCLASMLGADFFCRRRTSSHSGLFLGAGCSDCYKGHRLDDSYCASEPLIRGDLLLGSRRQKTPLALAHRWRSCRHRGMAPRLSRTAYLPSFLQQLLCNLRFSRGCHHSAYVVLHHWADDPVGRGDQ
jgi:hypothetical protein